MAIAAVVSLPIGVALGHFRRGGPLVTLLANATRAVPTLGLLYLLAGFPSFGVSQKTAIISLAHIRHPADAHERLGRPCRRSRRGRLGRSRAGHEPGAIPGHVEMPLAVPLIFAGLRSSTLQTFATATIASYVGSDTLGNLIQLGQAAGAPGQGEVLGAAIIIAFLAVVLDIVLAIDPAPAHPAPLRSSLTQFRVDARGCPKLCAGRRLALPPRLRRH